jgi:hypothetical protein
MRLPGVEDAAPETYDVIAFGPGGQNRFARYRGSGPVSASGMADADMTAEPRFDMLDQAGVDQIFRV